MLNANQTICQALLEGGWSQDEPEEEEEPTEETNNKSESSDKSDDEAKKPEADKTEEKTAEKSETFTEASGDLNNIVAEGLMKDKAAQEGEGEQSGEAEVEKEEPKKECLVEELDQEIENDNDEENQDGEEKSGVSKVQLKAGLNKDEKSEDKADENVEEKTEEGTTSIKVGVPNVTKDLKSYMGANEDAAVTEEDIEDKQPEAFKPKHDYSLMDELLEFLEVPAEKDGENKIESILCGYFNKIITALLQKQKGKTLEFLLLVQRGKIFDNLISHLQHFSLANLMLTLLGLKFFIEDYAGFGTNNATSRTSLLDWDNNSESDEGAQQTAASTERTAANEAEAEERYNEMMKVLNEKKIYVVTTLLKQMSKENPDDLEKTLNASSILQELIEDDNCFKLLINEGNLELMMRICCEGEANK